MACDNTQFSTIITAQGDISCKRADTFHLETEFVYEDDGTPVDLTMYSSLTASVKNTAKDTTYIIQFKIGDGFTIDGSKLTWDKSNSEMTIEAKGYVYDIEGMSSGSVSTIAGGSFIVIDDVTREGDSETP